MKKNVKPVAAIFVHLRHHYIEGMRSGPGYDFRPMCSSKIHVGTTALWVDRKLQVHKVLYSRPSSPPEFMVSDIAGAHVEYDTRTEELTLHVCGERPSAPRIIDARRVG